MPRYTERSLYHGWLPRYPEVHAEFLRTHISRYAPNAAVKLPAPVAATEELGTLIDDFFKAIEDSKDMKARFGSIFRQVNTDKKWAPADEDFRVHDLEHLKKALTSAISGPPKVYVVKREEEPDKPIGEPIGIPIYLVLDLLINTDAAHDLFRLEEFNTPMKALLDGWGNYLKNPGSNTTLDTSETGWLGPTGLGVLQQGLKGLSFEHTYGVSPSDAQKVYPSWDAFFIRSIKDFDKLRPIVVPDIYTAIHNACESTTFRIAHNVKLDDTFWLKSQNYSLWDMLGGSAKNSLAGKYAHQFVGGTVYQAFLAPEDYHHWHSPVKGTVLDTAVIPGTYYAALPDEGAPEGDKTLRKGDPHGALMRSQPWLGVAAARGVIIIKPESTSPIELVGFIGIGMVEVSTIDIRVSKDGSQGPKDVLPGTHMGMFHFGGSSHNVILKLKGGFEVTFKDLDDEEVKVGHHRWVNEIIGQVRPVKGA